MFKGFTLQKHWLDDFYDSLFWNDGNLKESFKILKIIKILFSWNSPSRGWVFNKISIKSVLAVENLSMESVVAQCQVCDGIKALDGIENIEIMQAILE